MCLFSPGLPSPSLLLFSHYSRTETRKGVLAGNVLADNGAQLLGLQTGLSWAELAVPASLFLPPSLLPSLSLLPPFSTLPHCELHSHPHTQLTASAERDTGREKERDRKAEGGETEAAMKGLCFSVL